VEFKDGKLATKKLLVETARARGKATTVAPTEEVVNKAMRDSKLNFSYTNNRPTTILWVGAIKKKADAVFPSICHRAVAATGLAATALDDSTEYGSILNVRADLESDEDDEDDDDGKGDGYGREGSSDGEERDDDGGKDGEDGDEGVSSGNSCWPSEEEDVHAY
jgi:hypothetical protein